MVNLAVHIVSRTELRVFEDTLEMVSGLWPTPLVRLRSYGDVWAKLEFFNPLSRSIKDRTIWYMVKKAMDRGELGRVLEEASSGNVAIALASLARMLGISFRAYGPKYLPRVTEVVLKVLGAEIIKLDREAIDEGFWKWVSEHARSVGATNLNQFENPDNPEAHYELTGPELVAQLRAVGKEPGALIAGMGTGGHITGIAKRVREAFGKVTVVGVQPAKGSFIPGIKRIEYGTKWTSGVDYVVDVYLEDAVEGVIELARREGLLVGLSSGAVIHALKVIREKLGDVTYVLIFPDDIFKYIDIVEAFLQDVDEE